MKQRKQETIMKTRRRNAQLIRRPITRLIKKEEGVKEHETQE